MKLTKKVISNKYFLSFIGIIFFFLLWVSIYFIAGQKQSVFPSPIETFEQMFIYLGDPFTYRCILGSLERMLIGFSIGSSTAILLGVIVGNFIKLKYVFKPTMVALKSIPTAALTFLFLVLAGLRNAPIYIVVIIVFPIVYEATIGGYSSIDEFVLMSTRVDGANLFKSNLKIKFPLAFKTISLGLISSFTLSFKIEIMAEVISGSSSEGLGRAIQSAYLNSSNGMVPTFAYSLIAILIMLLVTFIFDVLKKILKINA
ncbi:MAG: ABC transporter permease subunit [Bacilli bacterium]|nr:ABC transporter permease subunit [Bacilli bacterium]